jgi:hypothetical protein
MKVKESGVIGLIAVAWILGANAVIAGEVNGRGEPIPGGENGRSECSFSGQQDDPVADEGMFRGDRVQSWGQIPKAVRDFLRTIGLLPGDACNPSKASG